MKIRSLLLGSCALASLATAGYASDVGIVTSLDISSGYPDHDFDSFLLGSASTNAMSAAAMHDERFDSDQGGHTSGSSASSIDIGHATPVLPDVGHDQALIDSVKYDLELTGYGDIGVGTS